MSREGQAGGIQQGVSALQTTIGYTPPGAVNRNVTKNITDFGTDADWTAAAEAGIATTDLGDAVQVGIPAGTYSFPSTVDAAGRTPTYAVTADATVDAMKLGAAAGGGVVRLRRTLAWTYGTYDNAAAASVIANATYDRPAQVMGSANPATWATYTDRDSVALYLDNTVPPPAATIATATYTATTIVPGVALDASLLRVGMLIDTAHATKLTGVITAWATDGSSVTVSGWYAVGNTATGQVPADGTGAYLNPVTKAWPLNLNTFLKSDSHGNAIAGVELGVFQDKAAPVEDASWNPGLDAPYAWGFDCVNLGTYRATAGFLQRGDFRWGFMSRGAATAGFTVTATTQNPTWGFVHRVGNGIPFAAVDEADAKTYFQVNGQDLGGIQLGKQGSGKTQAVDFWTGTASTARDGQIIASGDRSLNTSVVAVRANTVQMQGPGAEPAVTVAAPGGSVTAVALTGAATGNPALIGVSSSDANAALKLTGKGTSGVSLMAYSSGVAPTTTDIAASQAAVWKNTADASVRLYYNDAGTLKSVALA